MRVGLLIYSEKQWESFVSSGFFQNIKKNYSVEIMLCEPRLSNTSHQEQNCLLLKTPNVLTRKLSTYIQCMELWRKRDISFAHRVRALNQFASKKTRKAWTSKILYEMNHWPDSRRLLLRLLSHGPFFQMIKCIEFLLQRFYIFKIWGSDFEKFDVLLIPFAGHTAYAWGNSVWLCKKLGIKSVALQENWDNVSSKTVITREPDFFAVWGAQSKSHLKSIHSIFKSKIFITGSPRFDRYFTEKIESPVAVDPNGATRDLTGIKYILLAGTGDGIDDQMLIEETFGVIKLFSKPPLIVYRPHPFTRFEHDLEALIQNYPNIVLDSGPDARKFGHQIPLVKSATLVINHFSTLTLEALISNRLVCVPLFLGREAKIGYDTFLDAAPHYVGLSLIPTLLTPQNQDEFRETIFNVFQTELNNIAFSTEWICKSSNYSIEVSKILEFIGES